MTIKKTLAFKQPQVGHIIRDLRLLAGLTQEQFAATLGVTYTTINRWEKHNQDRLKLHFKFR